jgi:hypothetical protein
MQFPIRFPQRLKGPMISDFSVPLLVTGLLWCSSHYDLTLAELTAAFLLSWLPWVSYRNWDRGERKGIPFFALLAGVYWLVYAVPLFWASHETSSVAGRRALSEGAITASLYLAVAGVVALGAGMKLAARLRWLPAIGVDVSATPRRRQYLRMILIFATLIKLFVPITAGGEGGRQILVNFENMVPTVSFVIFLRYYLRRRAPEVEKFLILGYVVIALVVGVSSGWLGSFVGLGIICMVVYTYERRRFPLRAALIVIPIILFFQPAKSAFRDRYWTGKFDDGYSERIAFWADESWKMWDRALSDQTGEQGKLLADATLSRLSLLQQTANIMELTPSRVPYQYGHLYSYIAITFIPRFLWPEKPSANDANHWYQVSYGLTLPQQLSNVSIAVGTLAESYISFGWVGLLLIMFPLGVFLGSVQRIFLRADSGLLFSSLGAVMVPQLLTVESQMAEYVAGLVQQTFVVLLVLMPTLKSHKGKTAARAMSPIVADRPA